MLTQQTFHLLIVRLEYLRDIGQTNWLTEIRRITLIPVIILSDNPEQDTRSMVQIGADICIYGKGSYPMIADLAIAQLRRFTEYNQNFIPDNTKSASFQAGDIFIDPARRVVEVRGQQVNLRPREFSLLLYFIRNQNIVLTPEQICEHAWGMDYTQSVFQSVHDLRKQIEPNMRQSWYIQTIHRVGYRFTAHYDETCGD